jgi:hypothetical protein
MRPILTFVCSLGLAAAAGYNPSEVLGRAVEKAIARAQTTPNYTCVETVKREYFEPVAASLARDCPVLLEQRRHPTPDMLLHLYSVDRLRLDVTMSSKGEIFSWSGASHFEDHDISQLVRNGPMGTGGFGGFLTAIFYSDARKFTFVRSLTGNGRVYLEYSFQVAQPDSHYKVKAGDSWVFIAYSGTFQVDAETADVVSMSITSGDSPAATGICQVTTSIDFARLQIGSQEFMLPTQTSQRFVYPHLEETENTTVFANCREFRGESTLTFAPEETAKQDAAKSAATPATLPRGLAFTFTLDAPVAADTAAAGDPFSGKLTGALRDSHGKLLAPKGSVVEGHLLRVQSFSKPPEAFIVFHPETLRAHDATLAMNAVRDWTFLLAQGRRIGKSMEILVPWRGEENAGVFRFAGDHVVIPAGFRSDWKTRDK